MNIEAAVLGACLNDATAYWRIADLTRPEHFTTGVHADIWRTLVELARKGDAIDPVLMVERHGSVVLDIASGNVLTANVRAYATKLADSHTSRAVTLAGKRIAELDGPGVDRLSQASQILRDISVGGRSVKTVREVLRPVYERMQRDCDEKKQVQGLSYGWGNLDAMTSGLHPGQLVVVAGRPAMGKSVFAVQLAMQVGLGGSGVHLATLEMTADECLERMIAAEGMVPFSYIKHAAKLEDSDWAKVTAASARLTEAPIKFDDEAFALDDIVARIRQHAMADGIGLAVIDYLGYVKLPKAERHDLAVQDATRTLKRLAKELHIPVVLLAQLNREVGTRSDNRPRLTDLRDSGAIEQDADVVILLHRADYYDPAKNAGYAEAIIAKQRNGPTGTCHMRHRFDVMRFEESEAPPYVEERSTGFAKRARGFATADQRAGQT